MINLIDKLRVKTYTRGKSILTDTDQISKLIMIYSGQVIVSPDCPAYEIEVPKDKILRSNEIIGLEQLKQRKTDEPWGYTTSVRSSIAEVIYLDLKDIDSTL